MKNKTKIFLIIVFIVMALVILVIARKNKKNSMENADYSNGIDFQDVVIEEVENEENSEMQRTFEIKDKSGQSVMKYDENVELDGETATYTIKNNSGEVIGETTDKDEIRLYVENPDYGKYAPTIVE